MVLLENVTGFLTSRRGADFADALLALNKLGYGAWTQKAAGMQFDVQHLLGKSGAEAAKNARGDATASESGVG